MVELYSALVDNAIDTIRLVNASMLVANEDGTAWTTIGTGIETAYNAIRNSIITPLGVFAIIVIAIKLLISPDPQSVQQNKKALIVVIAAVALAWIAPKFIDWAAGLGGGTAKAS